METDLVIGFGPCKGRIDQETVLIELGIVGQLLALGHKTA